MSTPHARPRFAPKVPVAWIVQLYRRDALGIRDAELIDKVGGRLYARCLDVLAVSDSLLRCPACQTVFEVPWIDQPAERLASCPGCGWGITAGAYRTLNLSIQPSLIISPERALRRWLVCSQAHRRTSSALECRVAQPILAHDR